MAETLSKEELLSQAKGHLDAGRYEKAAQCYERLLELSPHAHRVRLRLAEIYVRLKNPQQAIEHFELVAKAYTEEEFYLKAVTVYKNILRINPSLHSANFALGELYEKMGSAADAIHQYNIVIRSYQLENRHDDVLKLRKKIVELNPTLSTARLRLAEAYMVAGDEASSTAEYETLAAQLEDSGDEGKLIDLYEKILTRKPEAEEHLLKLCRMYFARRDYSKLIKWMTHSEEVAGQHPELLQMHAQALASQNQAESSRGKWRDLAAWHLADNNPEAAIRAYEEAFVVSADDAEEWEEEIEAVRQGAFAEIMESAEIRRRQLLEAEEAQEALEMAQAAAVDQLQSSDDSGDDDVTEPGKPAPSLAPEEVEALQRRAESGIQLAEAYQQMGMPGEELTELRKSLECYQRLLAAGAGDHTVLSAIDRIKSDMARLEA